MPLGFFFYRMKEWLSPCKHSLIRSVDHIGTLNGMWEDNVLFCPECGRMLAYRVPFRQHWDVYICQTTLKDAIFAERVATSAHIAPLPDSYSETWDEFMAALKNHPVDEIVFDEDETELKKDEE